MDKKIYDGATQISLAEYIPVDNFRIVSSEHRHIPAGISEVYVKIRVESKFEKSLTKVTSKNGRIYGFVRKNDKLKQESKELKISVIELIDWEESFVLFINFSDKTKKAFQIDSNEVKSLLENCLKPVLE